jgi:hypothetical protein
LRVPGTEIGIETETETEIEIGTATEIGGEKAGWGSPGWDAGLYLCLQLDSGLRKAWITAQGYAGERSWVVEHGGSARRRESGYFEGMKRCHG